jgi:hypothetical protein
MCCRDVSHGRGFDLRRNGSQRGDCAEAGCGEANVSAETASTGARVSAHWVAGHQ